MPRTCSPKAIAKCIGYLAVICSYRVSAAPPEPEFAAPISSLTIVAGSDAVLKCVVNNLGNYKVTWKKVATQDLLSIHTQVISPNERISVSTPDERTWYLRLRDVNLEDDGYYACQINTQPLKSQAGYLRVVEPPEFVTNMINRNVTVMENQNVTLSCKATGSPPPVIEWRREDKQPFLIGGEKVRLYRNDELVITGVTRQHMAAYLCVASNEVPPPISRRIYLDVSFPPLIWIQNQLVGAPIGTDITLECHTEAHPSSENYWTRDNEPILSKSERYKTYLSRNSYKVHMRMTIKKLQPEDYGSYKCVAKNTLGETEGSITLYKLKIPISVETERIYTEPFPTRMPKKTTAETTTDTRFITSELPWWDLSNFPGKQQKYGDGRNTDEYVPDTKSKAGKPYPFAWLQLLITFLSFIRTAWKMCPR